MELELGNLMFNTNANQKYECPNYIVALLREIQRQLDRIMWNINQKEFLTNNPNHPYEDNKSILVLSSNRATSNNTSLTTGRSAEELVAATPNYNTEQLTSHRQQQIEHG